MITAKPFPQPDGSLLLVFEGPKEIEPKTATSLEDAQRIVDFINRNYIIEKLTSWLHQRKYALSMINGPEVEDRLVKLQSVEMGLAQRKFVSLRNICAYVTLMEGHFKMLIPPLNSKHYKIFHRSILPILRFATGKQIVPD